MRRTTRGRLEANEAVSTLPVISLFVVLVTFLVATATAAGLTSLPVDVPSVASESSEAGEREEPAFRLTVEIFPSHFVVSGTTTGAGQEGIEATVARSGGERDLAALRDVLAAIRSEHPGHRNVILIPDPDISYEEVIDAAAQAHLVGLTELSLATSDPGRTEGG